MTNIVFYYINNDTIHNSEHIQLNRGEMAICVAGIVMNFTMLRLPAFCMTLEFLFAFFSIASIYSRVIAAFDRFLYIRNALKYNNVVTAGKTYWLIASVWTFSLGLASVTSMAHTRSFTRTTCEYPDLNLVFEVTTIMFVYGLPLVWLVIIYGIVFNSAYHQIKKLQAKESYLKVLRNRSESDVHTSSDYCTRETLSFGNLQVNDEFYDRLDLGSAMRKIPHRKMENKPRTSDYSPQESSLLHRLSLKTKSSFKQIRNTSLSLLRPKVPPFACFNIKEQDFTYNASADSLERQCAENRQKEDPPSSRFQQRLEVKTCSCTRHETGRALTEGTLGESANKNNSTKTDNTITIAMGANDSLPVGCKFFNSIAREKLERQRTDLTSKMPQIARSVGRCIFRSSGRMNRKNRQVLRDSPSFRYKSCRTRSSTKMRRLNGIQGYNSQPRAAHLPTQAHGAETICARPSILLNNASKSSVDPKSYRNRSRKVSLIFSAETGDDNVMTLDEEKHGGTFSCCGCMKMRSNRNFRGVLFPSGSKTQDINAGESYPRLGNTHTPHLTKSSILISPFRDLNLISPIHPPTFTNSESELLSREKTVTFDAKRETVTFIDSRSSVQPEQSSSFAMYTLQPMLHFSRLSKAYYQTFRGFRTRLSKLILVLCLIITCNISLWTPYQVLHATRVAQGLKFPSLYVRLCHCLGLLTCVMDPLIFGFLNIAFRQIVIRRFRSFLSRRSMLFRTSSLHSPSRGDSAHDKNPKRSFRTSPISHARRNCEEVHRGIAMQRPHRMHFSTV